MWRRIIFFVKYETVIVLGIVELLLVVCLVFASFYWVILVLIWVCLDFLICFFLSESNFFVFLYEYKDNIDLENVSS